jgi:hypothetical protein
MVLAAKVGIVLVTSPARIHPSTELAWSALGSTVLLRGLEDAPVSIVCDGYRTPDDLPEAHAARIAPRLQKDPCALSKRGIVASEIGDAYESYKLRLREEVAACSLHNRISVEELDSHMGFAMCVKRGLELSAARGDKFALILQHDRAFVRRIEQRVLERLLVAFDDDPTLRYVGFCSGTSKAMSSWLGPRYKLGHLLEARRRPLDVDGSSRVCLVPTVFWYDSNHIVHVERARQVLLEPYTHAPAWLRTRCGGLTLRKGDFVEDRFGVHMKEILISLREPSRRRELLDAFDFFGSFLLEEVDEPGGEDEDVGEGGAARNDRDEAKAEAERDGPSSVCKLADVHGVLTHVAHMDARGARTRSWMRLLPRLPGAPKRRTRPGQLEHTQKEKQILGTIEGADAWRVWTNFS